ncbi:MAG TPA: hypothetical protein VJX92_05305 [Methylomirabilota bacterium]|nr:hypothetical protein [Methylomirabilota bacterium]
MMKRAPAIIASVIGLAVGAYAGIHLVIPLVASAAAWWLGRALLPRLDERYLIAAAVQAGHLVWLALGQVLLGIRGPDLLDPLILLAGIAWLLAWPGLAPVVLLTVYQVVALTVNAVTFVRLPVGHTIQKALLVHLLWRLMALVLMWRACARRALA